MKYRNPVLSGFYPDPSICRVGDTFYLVTSSFEYFPGVPIFQSQDLIHWKQSGYCLDKESQLPLKNANSSGGIYAPTIRYHNGLFYLTTTNVSALGNFIVTSKKPEGPWSDPILIDQPGIDPSLFFDKDGCVYYTTSYNGAYQSQLDLKTGKILSKPKVIWKGTGGQYPEGPHLYYKDGWYYLLMAEGGTEYGHMVTIAKAKTVSGPFQACKRNPILSHRSYRSPIQATGHADLVEYNGDWFAVFHGIRPNGYPPCHHLGRETFLSPVKWLSDGFPAIGKNGHIAEEMEIISLAPEKSKTLKANEFSRDDFQNKKLALSWNFLRNPDPLSYSLEEKPGYLRLQGKTANLDDISSPTWIGRRQCHFNLHVATCLEFIPTADNEEAGLNLRMNEKHHYEIFFTLRSQKRSIVLRRRIGNLWREEAIQYLSRENNRLILAIEADKDKYSFYYGFSENELYFLGEGETRYLATEVAGGFTGVFIALYVTGNGKPCKNPAYFDWFEYLPK